MARAVLKTCCLIVLVLPAQWISAQETRTPAVTAIVGATVIDGTGRKPTPDATVLISGDRIVAVGPRNRIRVPADASIVNANNKFVVPGFIDTNVHLSVYDYWDRMARNQANFVDIAIEGAQLWLKNGVTTVRDSYGLLQPVMAARDTCRRDALPCPRILVAGNIIGFGGLGSKTFGGNEPDTLPSATKRQLLELNVEGVGEDLVALGPDSLRKRIGAYLDRGVDFIKYGGTIHGVSPYLILFSPRAQSIIVDEAHRRHKV